MTGLALLVALVAILAAVGFFLSGRTARQTLAGTQGELAGAREELEKIRGEQKGLRDQAKEGRDEAGKLRAELAAAKKKAFEQAEAAKKAGGAQTLREEIDRLGTRLAEAREEAAHAQERLKAAEALAAKAQGEVERLKAAEKARAEQPVVAAPQAAPVAAPAVAAGPSRADQEKLAAEKDRADKAEARLAEVRKKLVEVERDLKAARGRIETEKRVYMVQKGELELSNDRYAELRRRYDGLRKDHEELIEAVRQAAREEARMSQPAADAGKPEASNA